MQLIFYLPIFSTPCIGHVLYLMFRCDGDVMKSLDFEVVFERSKHTHNKCGRSWGKQTKEKLTLRNVAANQVVLPVFVRLIR